MPDLDTLGTILTYSDWANRRLLGSAAPLADAALDQPFDIGPGSLRRTLLHIHAGEDVWLRRWKGEAHTPWPNEKERVTIDALAERFAHTRSQRDAFLATLSRADLTRLQPYRDSRGSMFQATLGDMLLQGCIHSIHHRAQAVNILRRLGASPPELDFMMSVRKPAPAS